MLNPDKMWEGRRCWKKSRIGVCHTCYLSVQNVTFFICKTDIVPVILCGCEIWCLVSREEHRLRVCESRVVRRIFDMRGRNEQRDTEEFVVSFMSVTLHQILLTILYPLFYNYHHPLRFLKVKEFLDQWSGFSRMRKKSSPWRLCVHCVFKLIM